MAIVAIFALMLLVTLMKVFLPKGIEVKGKQQFELKLTFIERLVYQRVNLYSLGAVLALMTVTGSIANGFQLLIIVVTEAILTIPVKVTATTQGLAINRVLFREWSEFAGFTTSGRLITLLPKDGSRSFNIPVLAERQDALVDAIGHHLPRMKAGKEVRRKQRITVS
jgi:hypothetical protein